MNDNKYEIVNKKKYKLDDGSIYTGEMRGLTFNKKGKAVTFSPYGKGKLIL